MKSLHRNLTTRAAVTALLLSLTAISSYADAEQLTLPKPETDARGYVVVARKRNKADDDAYRACRARVHIGPNVHFGPNVFICGKRVS